jgi:glycosyltransferase involved in cell wall biosynthesis
MTDSMPLRTGQRTHGHPPLVSIVLTTRNRPQFLPLALQYCRWQDYPRYEVVLVDDSHQRLGISWRARPTFRHIRLSEPRPLGDKLNIGIAESRGEYILKMDDDDFYAANFLTQLWKAAAGSDPARAITFLQPFLFLDLRRLEVRRSDPDRCSGATLFFHRTYWCRAPFRSVPESVDGWFMLDHSMSVSDPETFRIADALESFLQVRHEGHLWNGMPDGEPVQAYLERQPIYHKSARELLPAHIFARYAFLARTLGHQGRD